VRRLRDERARADQHEFARRVLAAPRLEHVGAASRPRLDVDLGLALLVQAGVLGFVAGAPDRLARARVELRQEGARRMFVALELEVVRKVGGVERELDSR